MGNYSIILKTTLSPSLKYGWSTRKSLYANIKKLAPLLPILLWTQASLGQTASPPGELGSSPTGQTVSLETVDRAPLEKTMSKSPMGWILNPLPSDCETNESRFRQTFRSIQNSNLDLSGFRTLILEHCWQSQPGISPPIHQDLPPLQRTVESARPPYYDAMKFPKGLKPLSEDVHLQGYRLGILFQLPSCFSDRKSPPEDEIWRSGRLKPSSATEASSTLLHQDHEPGFDPTHMVRFLYEQGIDIVRLKSCLPSPFHRLDQYHRIGIAFKTVLSELKKLNPHVEPITVSLHDPEVLGVEAWSMDLASIWTFDTLRPKNWHRIFDQADLANRFSALSGQGHWNEPGPLWPLDSSWTWIQKKTQWNLWTMIGSPLLIPFDPIHLGHDVLKLVSNPGSLSIYHDHIGLQALPLRQTAQMEIWSKPLSRPGHRAVLVINKLDKDQKISFDPSDLGLEGPFQLRDVQTQKNLPMGTAHPLFTWDLAAHDSILFTVVGQEQNPMLPMQDKLASATNPPDVPPKNLHIIPINTKIPVYSAGIRSPLKTEPVRGVRYSQATLVQAPSVVRYFLGGQCKKFQSIIGLEDENSEDSWMGFEVWADGLRLFTSRPLTKKRPLSGLDLQLDSVNYLDLVTVGGASQFKIPKGQWIYPTIHCHAKPQQTKN